MSKGRGGFWGPASSAQHHWCKTSVQGKGEGGSALLGQSLAVQTTSWVHQTLGARHATFMYLDCQFLAAVLSIPTGACKRHYL